MKLSSMHFCGKLLTKFSKITEIKDHEDQMVPRVIRMLIKAFRVTLKKIHETPLRKNGNPDTKLLKSYNNEGHKI